MTITQEFYDLWRAASAQERPHQNPPTKEQVEQMLDILTEEQCSMILGQFDETEEWKDFRYPAIFGVIDLEEEVGIELDRLIHATAEQKIKALAKVLRPEVEKQ